ncbi:TonB-dependent receptor [Aquidulcibacter sp.]|uniref:TonB-dependent receptor n=1 Tax=Aquidulcibacter sp. TaxID=2052990 RepID=UPI0025BD51BA|nr:TonB-dependent receptor [Aquidulcibacter sp.]MCA3695354.1 TonB-dependent receptor [Aquidulcibacter sp.]
MSLKITRAALMGAVGSFALLSATSATAQTTNSTTAAPAEEKEAETIVVRGIRPIADSERAALQVQRNSPSLVAVVSADSIGQLPDQNIAFAVGRLPGVGIERDQGQARYVNLRGTPNTWTTIAFDGINVVSPEGRSSRFDNIPSVLAAQVVVTKAITPDMSGDTVAGNVNVRTRSAFDYPGFKFNAKLSGGIMALGGGAEVDTSFVLSNRFMDDKLGVLVQASLYSRDQVTDNWETDPYVTGGGNTDRRPGWEDRRWAREYENKPYRLTRGNISYSGRVDYRLNDTTKLHFSSIFTNFTDVELRSNYIFRLDNGATATGTAACPTTAAPQTNSGAFDICNGNTPNQGTVYGAQITSNFNSLDYEQSIWTNTLGADFSFAGWDATARLNYTESIDALDAPGLPNFASPALPTGSANTPANLAAVLADRPTVTYFLGNDNFNTVQLFRTVPTISGTSVVRARGERIFSIDQFPQTFLNISSRDAQDETTAVTGRFDATRDFNFFGGETTVKLGGLFTDRTKESFSTVFTTTAQQIAAAGRAPITYNDIAIDRAYLGDLRLGYAFRYHGKTRVDTLAAELKAANIGSFADQSANLYKVTENIVAGYAMATYKQDWGNVVFGVRAERTKNTGQALVNLNPASSTSVPVTVKTEAEDTLFFPSAHVNIDLNDEMKLRFGVTTGASRPDFDDLRPNFVINDTTQSISGGNPDAGPEKSVGLDAYFEWYQKNDGYFMVGAFYKDIKDVLFTQTDVFGRTDLDITGFARSGYSLSTIRNGGKGYLSGFEIAFSQRAEKWVEDAGLPDFLGGFGVSANATFTDSEVEVPSVANTYSNPTNAALFPAFVPVRKIKLPGTSESLYNISLIYEKYNLSARLTYQFRTAWGQSVGAYGVANGKIVPVTNGDVFWDDDNEMDLSIRYELNKNVEYFFDAVNLTDQQAIRYGDSRAFPIEGETFGRRYIMGVRINF